MTLPIEVVRVFQAFPFSAVRSIFLAGPTPRSEEVPTWRTEAVAILEELGFSGHVFVPETDDPSQWLNGFEAQEAWEDEGLQRADIIVFWVPRDLTLDAHGKLRMPAFTTNIEFGEHMKRGGIVVGTPPKAPNMGAFKKKAERYGIPVFATLRDTLTAAVAMIGAGERREGVYAFVPLHVWWSEQFQRWSGDVVERCERVTSVRVLKTFPEGNRPLDTIMLEVSLLQGGESEPVRRVLVL